MAQNVQMEYHTLLDSTNLLVLKPILATLIGLNEAIVLQQIHFWLYRSTNIKDGYKWVYNSYSEWEKQFPFWSKNTIVRTFSKLEERGLVVSAAYNAKNFDKTKWYRIDYDKLDALVDPNWVEGDTKLGKPIPETTTKTTLNVSNETLSAAQNNGVKQEPIRKDKPDVTEVVTRFETEFGVKLKQMRWERIHATNLIKRYGLEAVLQGVAAAALVRNERYSPIITNLKDLWEKWDKLAAFYRRRQQEQEDKIQSVAIITED